MSLPFIDRNPMDYEIEKFRLILSTYQDGSGMLSISNRLTLPGWRDFERTVASAFQGQTTENKAIYDVLINAQDGFYFGVSCKMRNLLREVDKSGRVTIELSNAAGKFWDILKPYGIHQQNYQDHATEVGENLLRQIEHWHRQVDYRNGGTIISEKSFFLSLQYEQRDGGNYQLFQFPIEIPDHKLISWSVKGRHLTGILNEQIIIEWYGFSGGQLKYYPLAENALWKSHKFVLELLPENLESALLNKAKAYFPERWSAIEV